MDVALHMRGGLQGNGGAADDARDRAAHDNPLGRHGAGYLAALAYDDFRPTDVALDLAIDLQRALADDLQSLADDLEIVADHRLGARFGGGGALARLRRDAPGDPVGRDRPVAILA